MKRHTAQKKFNQLRTQAEKLIQGKGVVQEPVAVEDPLKLIYELQTLQNELARSEALFRGIFDHMTSGSAIYQVLNDGSKGSDYIIKNLNKKALEIEGKPLEQLLGKSLLDQRKNIDNFGLVPLLKKAWKTGTPQFYPAKLYEDDLFLSYYENVIFKIPSGEVATIYTDVTDQKNNEKALKESQERFKLAMQFANDGLFDWNLVTQKIYYSRGWKRMLGYEPQEIKNDISEWERLTHPGVMEDVWEMLNQVIEKKRPRFEQEFRMRHKQGHWVEILSRANVVRDEQGKAIRVVGTHTNITERKHAENLVRDLSQRLIQAQEGERQMIACELHDSIAQNLSTLKLYCSRLFQAQSSCESDITGVLKDSAKLLDQTISAVRDLAYDLRPPSLDHLGLVHALKVFCEEFSEKTDICVTFQAAGIHGSTLNPDTQINLYRLVMEGLNNIRKHAAASQATIKLVGAYPGITLRIQDNGRGFDVKERERRIVDEKRMGLRSMKERVNLLQGQMSIHSQLNKGTEIVIKLPLKDNQK